MEGKWKLHWGIHRGTLMSRDCPPKPEEFDTKDEALERLVKIKSHFVESMGMELWFANLKAPGSDKWETIESGSPYF